MKKLQNLLEKGIIFCKKDKFALKQSKCFNQSEKFEITIVMKNKIKRIYYQMEFANLKLKLTQMHIMKNKIKMIYKCRDSCHEKFARISAN